MRSTDRKSPRVKRRPQAEGKTPARLSSKPAVAVRGRSRNAVSHSPARPQITDRQAAEEALRESEEKYRSVVERANDGIAIIQDTIVKYLNPCLAELWGGTVAEILGRPFTDYIHPDELPMVQDRYKRRMAGEVVTPTYETALKRKDGSKISVELNAGTITFHGERADLVIVRDITRRKEAENRLTAERNLLNTLIDHLPDNIFVKDVDGRIVLDNIAHRRLLGVTAMEEVVGKTDFDFFARNLAASYDADEKQIIHSGKALINREEPTADRDGTPSWLLTTKLPLRDHEGEITGIVGINRDITERKRAEEALQQSERHFHGLFDNATIGMYRTTPDGRILLSNAAGVHMLGFDSFEELAKRNLENEGSDAGYPRQHFRERMQNEGKVVGLESAWTRKDGSVIFVRESATAVRDAQGNILYYDGTFEDITERKKAEEALQRRAEELAALQATVLEITASHDLRALLQTTVKRAAELLGTKSGGLYLCDPVRRVVRLVVSYKTPRDYAGTVLKYGEGAAGVVAQTGKPLIIDDYRVWAKRAAAYEREQPFSAVIAAPMIWHDQVTGVIDLVDDAESRRFSQSDLDLISQFARHAAIAVENARLYEAAQGEIVERKQVEQALRQAEAKYRNIVDNATEGIFQSTPAGNFFTANPSLARMLGYDSPEELIAGVSNLNHEFYVEPGRRAEFVRQLNKDGMISTFESQVYRKDGSRIWVSENARTVLGGGGHVHYEGMMVDITERKQAEEELKRLSTHDSLTGLYNRGIFMVEMARLERGRGFPVSIVVADVDALKKANDEGGHAAGDTLLKRVAQVLTAAFRAEDVVARIGGDEFAVLLPGTDATSAKVALQRVRRVVEENNSANPESPLRLSFGVSTAEMPAPLGLVLNEADANMYREKRGKMASSEN